MNTMNPTAAKRVMVEHRIVRRLLSDLIRAGYKVGLQNEEGTIAKKSRDVEKLMGEIHSVDEELVVAYDDIGYVGSVYLVYGNSGYDVIADYSLNLETVIGGALRVADSYEGMWE